MMICFEKHEYKNAKGYGFWKSSKRYFELWIFPAGFDISSHSHPDENIETMLLFGKATFCRKSPSHNGVKQFKKTGLFSNMFRCLSIPAGDLHWFIVDFKWPLIVINFSSFIKGKAISASNDIVFPNS